MPVHKNHIHYSAADIARYHRGELSAAERHALEKAALDDPFLAGALEGYAVPGVQAEADMDLLRKKLAARIGDDKKEKTPVVALPRPGFQWWKVAAMIILVAGAGLLAYQLGFKNDGRQQSIALEEQVKQDNNRPSPAGTAEKTTDTAHEQDQAATINNAAAGDKAQQKIEVPGSISLSDKKAQKENAGQEAVTGTKAAEPVIPPAQNITDEIVVSEKAQEKNNEKREAAAIAQNNDQAAAAKAKARQEQNFYRNSNVFRGRVTDQQNNALPFANIVNEADNVGTYTDARGYFTLTSPDSVLNVQVRSVGFENSRAVLNNQATANQVILQEDRSLPEVIISRSQVNTNRARSTNMLLEEPEPADGWQNYDTYIANNLQVPEAFQRQRSRDYTGVVELSFEVDVTGNPVNIKVEKSLCESCDKEAIRLLKDGPKWKRKAKRNGRTTVTIPF